MIFALIVLQALIAISNAYHNNESCNPAIRDVTESVKYIDISFKDGPPSDLFECYWRFYAMPGKKIRINVTKLSITSQKSSLKHNEGLLLFGLSNPEFGVERVTKVEEGAPRSFTSYSYKLYVDLHAPQDVLTLEFKANYEAIPGVTPDQHDLDICGNPEIDVSKANNSWIVPVNGKGARNKQCRWRLFTRTGYRVEVTINTITFFSDAQCSINKIEFFDGRNEQAKSLGTICKTDGRKTFLSSSNQLFIQFSAFNISKGQGFKGSYKQIAGSKGPKIAFSVTWILAALLASWCIHY